MGRSNYASEITVTITRIGVSILLKFMLGSDDLVWLAPFMARAKRAHEKVIIGAKYTASVVFLTLLACALATLIHAVASKSSDDDRIDETIATIAAGLLVAYAAYMAETEGYRSACVARFFPQEKADDGLLAEESTTTSYGTLEENENDDDDDDDDLGPVKVAVRDALLHCNACVETSFDTLTCGGCACCLSSSETSDDVDKEKKQDEKDRSRDLSPEDLEAARKKEKADNSVIIVAFLGSMDDFMVYFTLALSSQLAWYELAIGITIGSILIALIVATLLQSSERVASCVEVIPVPLVLVGLAAFILVSAWTSFDGV